MKSAHGIIAVLISLGVIGGSAFFIHFHLSRNPGNIVNYNSHSEPGNDLSFDSSVEQSKQSFESPKTSISRESVVLEDFSSNYTVIEAGSKSSSNSKSWWVSSGGYFYSKDGVGGTVQGKLPQLDQWRVAYSRSNPRDTDGGYYPQNIFRLVQRGSWANLQQQAYFKIVADNLSESEYRNQSNGLLFFNRYQDAFNLYYTGIRVDGYVTVKKKIDGVYYTLSYEPLSMFSGSTYDRDTHPNLLPQQQWIGMRSIVTTNHDGTVNIKVYVDEMRTGDWELVTEAVDDGVSYGGPVFEEGHGGIRTDFMDVQFDDYRIEEL